MEHSSREACCHPAITICLLQSYMLRSCMNKPNVSMSLKLDKLQTQSFQQFTVSSTKISFPCHRATLFSNCANNQSKLRITFLFLLRAIFYQERWRFPVFHVSLSSNSRFTFGNRLSVSIAPCHQSKFFQSFLLQQQSKHLNRGNFSSVFAMSFVECRLSCFFIHRCISHVTTLQLQIENSLPQQKKSRILMNYPKFKKKS